MGLRDVLKIRKSDGAEENAVFVSTRGGGAVTAPEAVLRGLAPDGGLYADPGIGSRPFDVQGCLALGPLEQAERILTHLLPGFPEMGNLVHRAYAGRFSSEELTPLVPVGDQWVLELFHGRHRQGRPGGLSRRAGDGDHRLFPLAGRLEGAGDADADPGGTERRGLCGEGEL